MDINKFSEFIVEKSSDEKMSTFYKIIDRGKSSIWTGKKFIKNKKTMVTKSIKEVGQINPKKTAVKLTVPDSAIIDTEGNWAVLELYPVKSSVVVQELDNL